MTAQLGVDVSDEFGYGEEGKKRDYEGMCGKFARSWLTRVAL